MRGCQVGLISETWEKEECTVTAAKMEEIFMLDNIECFSSPRPRGRVGGGVAVLVDRGKYIGTKIEIANPHALEVVWVELKPRSARWKDFRKTIVCAFYIPPNSKKRSKLTDHLVSTTNHLLSIYDDAVSILIMLNTRYV